MLIGKHVFYNFACACAVKILVQDCSNIILVVSSVFKIKSLFYAARQLC